MRRTGFDNDRYLAEQTAAIRQRVRDCGDRLYLEFGGKLLFDYPAARVRYHVVTVDTSFGNLAGALGRPLWMLLARSPDWRWGLGSDTGPWYPSARLVRQDADESWTSVLARVAASLAAQVRGTGA